MDRHDLHGESAEDVARAHARDLEVQDAYGVSFLSYWFDERSGSAFCLARASGAEDMATVHRESHGLIPNEIIPVSEDSVLRFLGVVRNPADASEATSAFRTVLFTDIEGSTALAEKLGPAEFIELLSEHDRIVRQALLASRGREVKHTGDGIMASFDSVSDGLESHLRSATDCDRETKLRRLHSAFASDLRPVNPSTVTAISSAAPSTSRVASVLRPTLVPSSCPRACRRLVRRWDSRSQKLSVAR